MSNPLPQFEGGFWLTDGGLETTLIFDHDVPLPSFAAFPLLDSSSGRQHLRSYFDRYRDLAARHGRGFVLDTPTWRASLDWGASLGYASSAIEELNRRAVEFVRSVASRFDGPTAVSGLVGPRMDGYVVSDVMTAAEYAHFHRIQARAFADTGADLVTALTMTHAAEAAGVALAAREAGLPVVISFTVETDGLLPDRQPLAAAIAEVDAATDTYPAYFMVNCAHPEHFASVLASGDARLARIRGIRANASRASHAELDEATMLDRGDPAELASHHLQLRAHLAPLAVVGGCCGTDRTHIDRIATVLSET